MHSSKCVHFQGKSVGVAIANKPKTLIKLRLTNGHYIANSYAMQSDKL